MDRRRSLLTSLAGALAMPPGALAQRSVYRIGVLFPEAVNPEVLAALREGLKELDVIEGRLPALARELVDSHVDILVAASTQAAVAARDATRKIPKAGLVISLARAEGNLTGLSATASDYAGKMLQLLREVAPRARRIDGRLANEVIE